MSLKPSNHLACTLREQAAHYVTQGQPVAVLLTLEEYEHYLDLLDDEADSQNEALAARLIQASARPTRKERLSFPDYLRQHETSHAEVQGRTSRP